MNLKKKIMLEGKAKELLEQWLIQENEFHYLPTKENAPNEESVRYNVFHPNHFYELPLSMQWGVLLSFGRSQDVWIEVISETPTSHFIKFLAPDIMSPFYELCEPLYIEGKYEDVVFEAAITKLNTLINE